MLILRELFAHRGMAISCAMLCAVCLLEFPSWALMPKMILPVLLLSGSQPRVYWWMAILAPWFLKSALLQGWANFYSLDTALLLLGAAVYTYVGHWLRFLESMSGLVTFYCLGLTYTHLQGWDPLGMLSLAQTFSLPYTELLGLIMTELLTMSALWLSFSVRWAERLFDQPVPVVAPKGLVLDQWYLSYVACMLVLAYFLDVWGWALPLLIPMAYVGHRLVLAWVRLRLKSFGYLRATVFYYSLLCLSVLADVALIGIVGFYTCLGLVHSFRVQMRLMHRG